MKYLKPYNEAIKKLKHKSSNIIDDSEIKEDLKINKLIETGAIYDISYQEYNYFFWQDIDLYSLTTSLAKNYKSKFSYDKLTEKDYKRFFMDMYVSDLVKASKMEDDPNVSIMDTSVYDYIDDEIGWDSPLLIDYFDSDQLFDFWFDEYVVETIDKEEIIKEYGDPWNKKNNKLDKPVYDYYYKSYFNEEGFFRILLKENRIDIDVDEEYREYLKQHNIKKFKI